VGSFSINTNIASLQAQNYLRVNANFQSQTINEVTSGLRIVQSGDDAAGLAIANGYRSDEAVLTQGIQNANNGLSQLQIMDGGMSNISQLLDRARTLATESASGTFTGDRSVLNGEYQSVLTEINRQAQAIGLNQGGTFAKSLSVFIGGGDGPTAASAIANGSVAVDLSTSTVDTQSLGLQGFTAGYQVASGSPDSGLYDLGDASTTSVSNILAQAATAGSTSFVISGPGFSGGAGGAITVNVNTSNVADTASLVTAINSGIQAAATAGSSQAKAFGDAPTMLSSDPPTQTRLRRLVSRDFTPRRIRELEPRIREIAKNLIDAAERKGEFDVMADLANPLPVMVISDLLGVPPEEETRYSPPTEPKRMAPSLRHAAPTNPPGRSQIATAEPPALAIL